MRPVLVNWKFLATLCGKRIAAEAKKKLEERDEKNERTDYGDSRRRWW
jgi:hypothetical protein